MELDIVIRNAAERWKKRDRPRGKEESRKWRETKGNKGKRRKKRRGKRVKAIEYQIRKGTR